MGGMGGMSGVGGGGMTGSNFSHLGIQMPHVLRVMLQFCDDQLDRKRRQVQLVTLCEELVSWVPQSYFEQRNLSDTGYGIYFVSHFGRGASSHNLHKPGLHRKSFIRNIPASLHSETMKNSVFTNWTSSKMTQGKSSANPVSTAARQYLVEVMDIWLHESSNELSMRFSKELEYMQRYLMGVDPTYWSPILLGGNIVGGGVSPYDQTGGIQQPFNLQQQPFGQMGQQQQIPFGGSQQGSQIPLQSQFDRPQSQFDQSPGIQGMNQGMNQGGIQGGQIPQQSSSFRQRSNIYEPQTQDSFSRAAYQYDDYGPGSNTLYDAHSGRY